MPINNKWIALCTVAIGISYGAGYLYTDTKNVQATSNVQAPSISTNVSQSSIQPGMTTTQNMSNSSTNNTVNTTSISYKDGTFTGTGTNQYGTVSVQVTIQSHKITSVKITNVQTHYPEQAITSLPNEVIAQQSSNVDIVSGATGSSEDFINAVSQALQNAQQ